MKKSLFLTSALLITFILTTCISYAQEKVKLEYKFEKGKTYLYKDVTTGDMTQEMMGREMKMKSESHSLIRLVVDNVDKEKQATLIVSSDSVFVHSSSSMGDTTINVKEIEGKRTKIFITNLGKVLKRETIDSIKVSGRMAAMANREAFSFPVFSEKSLKIGDRWNSIDVDTTTAPSNGQMITTRDVEYTLAGKEKKNNHDCYKVTFTGKSSTEGKFNMQGMEFYIEGSGKINGSFYFAPKLGMITELENIVESDLTYATVGENPMTIPVTQKVTVKRSLIK